MKASKKAKFWGVRLQRKLARGGHARRRDVLHDKMTNVHISFSFGAEALKTHCSRFIVAEREFLDVLKMRSNSCFLVNQEGGF